MTVEGSLVEPFQSLKDALENPRLRAGHTIYLGAGVHYLPVAPTINVASVTVRPYPGEVAVVDGALSILAAGMVWRDLVIRYSGWTTRETEIEGSAPADLPTLQAIDVHGAGCKFINCTIHDMSGGPGVWKDAVGTEVYGCVIFNNGWSGPDRGHGHAVYAQSLSNTPHVFKNNILFHNFSTGLKMYAESDLDGYQAYGNTSFCNGVPYATTPVLEHKMWNIWTGTYGTVSDVDVQNNMTYHRAGEGESNLFCWGGTQVNLILVNNHMPDGIQISETAVNTTESGNYAGPGAGNAAFLRVNEYDANRANLTIYNEAGADSIAVDVSAAYDVGQQVRVWSAIAGVDAVGAKQDVATPTVAGDGTITVDMRAVSHSVAAPYQWTAPATTFPLFGAFVLEAI